MDNRRRLSARAEMGAAPRYSSPASDVSFLDKAIDLTKANWELIFFIGLMIIAVMTRVWDLGPRALHHDESIHAYYSNQYYKGGGYAYDPTYHGPFLYHIVALGFFLFGVTDATARIMPALFGIGLIGLCWLLRPFIGRIAAILAVFMLIFSPSISYYSRSLRHDIFALAGLALLFVSILWFMRTHQARWVYLGSAGLAVAFCSHELTYIVALIFVLFLAIAAFAYRFFSDRATMFDRFRKGDEDVNPVMSALQALRVQRWTTIGGILIFLAIYTILFTNVLTKFTYYSQWLKTDVPFIVSAVEGLAYWMSQHGVARGNQPHWYYMMLMPIYDPLALFAGFGTIIWLVWKAIVGGGDRYAVTDEVPVSDTAEVDQYGVALPSLLGMRGLALGFLAFWSVGALIAFSIAGERLPWLVMQISFPFTLLAAAGLGRLVGSLEWRPVLRNGGVILGVVVVLFLFSAFALMQHLTGAMPPITGQTADLQNGLRGVLLALFTIGLLALASWLAYKIYPGRAVAVVGATFAILLSLYGIRSMWMLNYLHGDVPVEMMIYTQSAPDVPLVADRILRLSRDETAFDAGRSAADVTGGRSLAVSIDQAVEWPFDWYFRDMRAISYFNSGQWQANQAGVVPPNQPVIIASDESVANTNFQNLVKDKYASQKFVLRWWFPEEVYKTNNEGDLGKALAWMLSPAFTKYLLYRDPGMPLGSTNFTLYVRNDLAVKVGMGAPVGGTGTSSNPSGSFDPNVAPTGMFDMQQGANRGNFNLPRGIAHDSQGNFYVVDTANMRVQKFDKTGKWLSMFGSKGNGDGQFTSYDDTAVGTGPGGIAVDSQGNVYVADTWNHRIEKFDSNGKFLNKWGSFINISDPASANDSASDSKFFGPRGVAVGPDGNVYVSDTGNKRVLIFDSNGKFLRKIDSGMSPTKKGPDYPFNKPGEFNEPIGVAVDKAGNVYVADSLNKRIQKFDNTGKFVTTWAVPGNAWDPGPYLEPFIAVDDSGNVYVTAPTGKTVYKFSPNGETMGQKSNQGAITLKTPTGITVLDGNVYVVDTGANGVVNLGPIQ